MEDETEAQKNKTTCLGSHSRGCSQDYVLIFWSLVSAFQLYLTVYHQSFVVVFFLEFLQIIPEAPWKQELYLL